MEKNISFELDLLPKTIMVEADREMLKTILRNLISNSIKFSFPKSKIIFSASESDDFVYITIEDFGVGISSAIKAKLFAIDEKISTLGTNNEIGTGLGLVLCKEFMTCHNGAISIKDKSSMGSIFELKFPKKS
jgi:signal transduction histidine kinase